MIAPRCRSFTALGLVFVTGVALAGCGEAGEAEPVGVSQSAITSETARIRALLEAGAEGDPGFLLKRVGGPLLENFNETLAYDPASSIKIVVGVSLLRRIDAGASFNLNTPVTHFFELSGSCPIGSGGSESRTLGDLLNAMLVSSDNAATRTLIDFLGGFSAINATAQSIGMTFDEHGRLPGLSHSQYDHAGGRRASLRGSRKRHAAIACQPRGALRANAGGRLRLHRNAGRGPRHRRRRGRERWSPRLTRGRVRKPDSASLQGRQRPLVRSELPIVYSISGLAEIPTCNGSTRSSTNYAFGLFISNGTDEFDTRNTFFSTHAEVLRRPIREALATWANCSAPSGTNGARCVHNGECDSFVCQGGLCRPPQCAPSCNRGAPCGANNDCGSDVCSASGTCAAPACSPHCSTGQVCGDNNDCSSRVCTNNLCAPSACAPRCNTGAPCGSNADCSSRRCTNGICARR